MKNQLSCKALSLLLTLLLVLSIAPGTTAFAASEPTPSADVHIDISYLYEGNSGFGWYFSNGQLLLAPLDGITYEITNYSGWTNKRIAVASAGHFASMASFGTYGTYGRYGTYATIGAWGYGSVGIILNNVNIDTYNGPALNIASSGVSLWLKGQNTLKSNDYYSPGLRTNGSSLTINGPGKLAVGGGHAAPAIGGGLYESGGDVTINGGIVVASAGYDYNTAIGNGQYYYYYNYYGYSGRVTLNGGLLEVPRGYIDSPLWMYDGNLSPATPATVASIANVYDRYGYQAYPVNVEGVGFGAYEEIHYNVGGSSYSAITDRYGKLYLYQPTHASGSTVSLNYNGANYTQTLSVQPYGDNTLYLARSATPASLSIYANPVEAQAGGTVDIPFFAQNNPGIAAYDLELEYDSNILTPVSVTNKIGGNFVSNLSASGGVHIVWTRGGNYHSNGELFSVRFQVNADAPTGAITRVGILPGGEIINESYRDVLYNYPASDVSLKTDYGDVNCDGEVDARDLILLMQYLADLSTLSGEGYANADVYPDGALDTKDVLLLQQYLLEPAFYTLGQIPRV